MLLNSLMTALPFSITTTGQSPTSALSMPNSSLPHHSASPKACRPLPPAFIAGSTSVGSTLPAFSAPARHRSRIEAYSQDTAPHSPGQRSLYSA